MKTLRGLTFFFLFIFILQGVARGEVFEVPSVDTPTLSDALLKALLNSEEDVIYLVADVAENVLIDFNWDSDKIVIEGKGGKFKIDGGGKDRCMNVVVSGGHLVLILRSLLLSNGASLQNQKGGGILFQVSEGATLDFKAHDLTVQNCLSESFGGGVACVNYGSATLSFAGCVFKDNQSSEYGGGVFVDGAKAEFENCLIAENASFYGGGGIYAVVSDIELESSTISGNRAQEGLAKRDGGGVYLASGSSAVVRNSIIWGNVGSVFSKDIYLSNLAGFEASYSCLPLNGEGCISEDPKLDADYALSCDSPCVDAGTPSAHPLSDLNGAPRPVDGDNDGEALPDMGAFELQSDITPPSEVQDLEASPATYSVFLSWSDPENFDFLCVRLYVREKGEGWERLYEGSEESYTAEGLSPSTKYAFKITTVDTSGNESQGKVVEVATLEEGSTPNPEPSPDLTPPSEVSDLFATSSTDSITLSWYTPSDSDLATCRLYGGGGMLAELPVSPDRYVSYTLDGLEGDTLYVFRITTLDSSGNESEGRSISVRTLKVNLPPVIKEIRCDPSEGSGGTLFTLDAVVNDPEGESLSYKWRLEESDAGLLFSDGCKAYFIAFTSYEDKVIEVSLQVKDPSGNRAVDSAFLSVRGLLGIDSDGDGVEDDREEGTDSDPSKVFLSERGFLIEVSSGRIKNFSLGGDNPYRLFLTVEGIPPSGEVNLNVGFPLPLRKLSLSFWKKGEFEDLSGNNPFPIPLVDGGPLDIDGRADGEVHLLLKLSTEYGEKGGCVAVSSSFSVGGVVFILPILLICLRRRL